jgi:DNA-binding response OmpR family regulator
MEVLGLEAASSLIRCCLRCIPILRRGLEKMQTDDEEVIACKTTIDMVLLIDNNEEISKMIKKALKRKKIKSFIVSSKEDAITALVQKKHQIKLVVLDQDVTTDGSSDGVELCAKMKTELMTAVPIIAMSSDCKIRNAFMVSGASVVLTKPIKIRKIVTFIRLFLKEKCKN